MTEHSDRLRSALADRYAVQEELGSGGMAVVYLAGDLRHERDVAVKLLRPELAVAMGGDRWREIKLTAKLNHPHILGGNRGLMRTIAAPGWRAPL